MLSLLSHHRMLRKSVPLIIGYVLLLGLWMMYTSSPRASELYVGIVVATLGVIGSSIINSSGFGRFEPRARWIALLLLEPWYVLVGSYRLATSLVRTLLGLSSRARLRAIHFHAGGDDPESSARRTLAIAYLTIPPDSIVLGIDRHHDQLVIHEIEPTPLPLVARKLGAYE